MIHLSPSSFIDCHYLFAFFYFLRSGTFLTVCNRSEGNPQSDFSCYSVSSAFFFPKRVTPSKPPLTNSKATHTNRLV